MTLKEIAFCGLAASVGWAGPSMAQVQPPQPPMTEALQQRVIALTGESIQWQAQSITLQRQVDELTKELEALKAKPNDTPKQ